MASNNGWNSFMQSRQARTVMYGLCVFFCVFYAVDALMELLSPERSAAQIEMIGAPGYYAMTIIRLLVLLGTGVAFGRIVIKTMQEGDE